MARVFLTLQFILITTTLFAQREYDSLIYTLPKPDLKRGLPHDVLISPDNKFFLVAYDFNPSYLELFELKGFKKLKSFRIRGHIYLSSSLFHSNKTEVYIDIGKRINIGKEKVQYYLIDLDTGDREKVKCEDGPKGCEYGISSPFRNDILKEYQTFDNSLLFKIENKEVNIYQ